MGSASVSPSSPAPLEGIKSRRDPAAFCCPFPRAWWGLCPSRVKRDKHPHPRSGCREPLGSLASGSGLQQARLWLGSLLPLPRVPPHLSRPSSHISCSNTLQRPCSPEHQLAKPLPWGACFPSALNSRSDSLMVEFQTPPRPVELMPLSASRKGPSCVPQTWGAAPRLRTDGDTFHNVSACWVASLSQREGREHVGRIESPTRTCTWSWVSPGVPRPAVAARMPSSFHPWPSLSSWLRDLFLQVGGSSGQVPPTHRRGLQSDSVRQGAFPYPGTRDCSFVPGLPSPLSGPRDSLILFSANSLLQIKPAFTPALSLRS